MTSNKLHYFSAGYNYYGTERLYSGVTGQEMEADIFMGIVYYQRLRHMVSDKFQVSYHSSPSCRNYILSDTSLADRFFLFFVIKMFVLPIANNTISHVCPAGDCRQWANFTMGPNEQNQHFAELRLKICLCIHALVLLKCLPSLDVKFNFL